MRLPSVVLALATIALAPLGCSFLTSGIACQSDEGCPYDGVCQEGVCVEPGAADGGSGLEPEPAPAPEPEPAPIPDGGNPEPAPPPDGGNPEPAPPPDGGNPEPAPPPDGGNPGPEPVVDAGPCVGEGTIDLGEVQSQSALDAAIAAAGNVCTYVLTGDVNIHGNVNNLDVLRDVTRVEGDLRLNDLDVENLRIDQLTEVTGRLEIRDFEELENLNLDALESVGDLILRDLDLESLQTFSNLTTVTGRLEINNLDRLSSTGGLEGLTAIGGELRLTRNNQLTGLGGLGNVTTIGSHLRIEENQLLATLAALAITDVSGDVRIFLNPSLSGCAAIEFADALTTLGGATDIRDNGAPATCPVPDAGPPPADGGASGDGGV